MRIKKVSQTTPTQSQIVDGYSTSTTDGYSCNYVNGLNTYSTDEIRVGTWINGKPIYRKVVSRNQNITNGHAVDLSSLNIDELIHIGSRHKLNNLVFMFNSFDSSSNKVTIHQNNDTLEVWTGTGVTYYSTIWIEYTKTTD